LRINDLAALRSALAQNLSVLYIADNAGETVFDRVLIESIVGSVTYVVKSGPIINECAFLTVLSTYYLYISLLFQHNISFGNA
jgi:uncharacterized protein with ATP-grasp and redox domains